MYFQVWFGQMRPKPKDDRWAHIPGNFYFNAKTPKAALMMRDLRPPGDYKRESVRYDADANGVITVHAVAHIKTMIALGYPLWDGITKFTLPDGAVQGPRREGLIWPDNPEFDKRVYAEISDRR